MMALWKVGGTKSSWTEQNDCYSHQGRVASIKPFVDFSFFSKTLACQFEVILAWTTKRDALIATE